MTTATMAPARAHSRGVRPFLTRASRALTFAIDSRLPVVPGRGQSRDNCKRVAITHDRQGSAAALSDSDVAGEARGVPGAARAGDREGRVALQRRGPVTGAGRAHGEGGG